MASKFVFADNMAEYGTCKFKGTEAAKYLTAQGLPLGAVPGRAAG